MRRPFLSPLDNISSLLGGDMPPQKEGAVVEIIGLDSRESSCQRGQNRFPEEDGRVL